MKIYKSEKPLLFDSGTYPYPFGDEDCRYYMLCEDDAGEASASALLSSLAVCRIDDSSYETYAYTMPSKRRKGCFTALWNKARSDLADEGSSPVTVSFVTSDSDEGAEEVLKKLCAAPARSEFFMGRDLTDADEAAYCGISDDNLVSYEILPWSEGCAYLYSFTVREEFRGLGVGRLAFSDILAHLRKDGCRHICLQVSGDNTPALRIYEGAGLTVERELHYHDYII